MTDQDHGRPAQPIGRPADILVIGDAAMVDTGAEGHDLIVHGVAPGARADRALLGSHRGVVVVVVVPPATDATVRHVARLRRDRPGIRVVLVDQATPSDRRLAALRAGFDDALPRELDAREIGARVAIQLQRARAAISTRLTVGPGVELDLESRALRRRGRFVHLRPLEFRLLEALASSPGRPLSRAMLTEHAWGTAPPVGSRTLDVHMRWLREKVERDPNHPEHLLTVRGIGYQLEPLGSGTIEQPPSGRLHG